MDSPSKVTLDYLKSKGITNIYKTNMPDLDICTCLYDSGGYPNDGNVGKPTIMVRHRNTDYENGYSLMQNVKNYLDNVSSGSNIFSYQIIGDINYLGKDEVGRYDYTLNLIAYKDGI